MITDKPGFCLSGVYDDPGLTILSLKSPFGFFAGSAMVLVLRIFSSYN